MRQMLQPWWVNWWRSARWHYMQTHYIRWYYGVYWNVQSSGNFIGRHRATLTSEECFRKCWAWFLTHALNSSVARCPPMKSLELWTLPVSSQALAIVPCPACSIKTRTPRHNKKNVKMSYIHNFFKKCNYTLRHRDISISFTLKIWTA